MILGISVLVGMALGFIAGCYDDGPVMGFCFAAIGGILGLVAGLAIMAIAGQM